MASRTEYRTTLSAKFVGIEDSGYGDFDFDNTELDEYLDLSVTRLFPALYQRIVEDGLSVVEYGTRGLGQCDATLPERTFRVESATELEALRGWRPSTASIININLCALGVETEVNVHYWDAFILPVSDSDDAGIPAIWTPAIVLGAVIEALESRQDTGVRPDPQSGHPDVPLLDRLGRRYDQMVSGLSMNAPVIEV